MSNDAFGLSGREELALLGRLEFKRKKKRRQGEQKEEEGEGYGEEQKN